MLNDAIKIAQVNFKLNEKIRLHFKENFTEIRTITTPYGELGEILYHIFESPNYWMNILTEENVPLKSYNDLRSSTDFFDEWRKVDQRLLDYLEKNAGNIDYSKTIHVMSDSGDAFDSTIEDLLLHISHHSFYHRGALGAIVRQNQLAPLPSSNWSFMK